jgi:osmoprotectant transport system substrate-binding protein
MRRGSVAALVVACTIFSAVSAAGATRAARGSLDDEVVTVGSFDFAESRLLAEIYSQALEADGLRVRRSFGIGPREVVLPAMAAGLVELVPEYAGTALRFSSLGQVRTDADVEATHAQLARRLADLDVTPLAASPAQDANTFVVTRDTAATHALENVSDLAAVAGDLTFGGPPECPVRPLCLRGLERVYGVTFGEVVELDAGGPVTKQALRSRAVDVGLLFTTDPDLAEGDLVELVDDLALQPAENVTPLVRDEVVERFGRTLTARVDAVSTALTTDELRQLNAQVLSGTSVRAVASRWLEANGLE